MGSISVIWRSGSEPQNQELVRFSASAEVESTSCNSVAANIAVPAESERFVGKSERESARESDEILSESRSRSALEIIDRREIPPQSSLWCAAFNLLTALFGTGILTLPYTILRGGWVSLAAFLILPIICVYTATILVDCLYEHDPDTGRRVRVHSSYEDLGEAVWPRFGRKVVTGVFQVTMFLVSTSFLVLAGSFLESTFPDAHVNKRLWTIAAAAVVLPTMFLKNIPQIAWVSTVGVIANVVPVAVILWHGFSHSKQWRIRSIPTSDLEGVFVSINIIAYSYGFHGLVIGVEDSVAKKPKIYFVVYACVFFATVVNVLLSLCGYLSFTDKTQDLITNNLPLGTVLYVTNVAIAVKVVFSYALPVFFVVECFDTSSIKTFCLQQIRMSPVAWFVLLRLWVFFLTVAVALFLPHFAVVIAFTGSIGSSSLIFLFPAIFHLKLKMLNSTKRVCDYLVFLLGSCITILGVFLSVKEVIRLYT